MRPPGTRLVAVLSAGALSGAFLTGCGEERRTAPEPRVLLGANAQNRRQIEEREADAGRRLPGVRVFRRWDEPLLGPDMEWARSGKRALFVSVKARRKDGAVIRWRDIADARRGEPLHDDVLAQARELKAFGGTVHLVFNHEPEARPSRPMGSAADYVAAWRRVVRVHRKEGVTNVRYVWTVTHLAFGRNGGREAEAYYPGDDYVDAIGVDAYNWYTCLSRDTPWLSLRELIEPHRRFGLRHPGKPLMVLEWASAEDKAVSGRKAAWIREAAALFRLPDYRGYTALLYWDDRHAPDASHIRCDLDYRSSPSALEAWREMVAGAPYRAP
ncbi:hypothetical protein GCM10009678_76360 [Actinomadura kijaniata]|uniref:GH26 domain-containing protein n=1 Tax=Actinomadura namibiensis TaxID=182080 RepID=A0A7W3M0H7_ACTNM|nr:glycosyl hydrolase [Actinomadura namibiensis]MBA8957624.1 hypothetical protein [Actinomadura namibiensis]